MLNNEKTIRFEDFAAVSQDGGDVLGKVLYYSLSSILIDRDELESLCDAVGFPKGRSNRTAMGDAFRSATGDIYERRVVKTDSGPQIFKVYCRDNKGGNASVISRELVKETVHEDTNEYRKLANITFNKTSKLFSYSKARAYRPGRGVYLSPLPVGRASDQSGRAPRPSKGRLKYLEWRSKMNKEKKDRPSIEAPQAVKHPDKHPPCYRSETRNPYPLCLGWGMKACAHCCLWTDYDSDEDESRVNLPLSLAQLQKMDGTPAWWECGPEYSCWGIIAVDSSGRWEGIPFFQGRWREVNFVYNIEARNMEIYRHPPYEET